MRWDRGVRIVELVVLGAGTPTPTPERFGSSGLLAIGDERLLFDCGPATTHKLVRAGVSPTAVDRLFFTHHHFDHDVDYPCFLLTRWDQSADRFPDLQVYGPAPTRQLTHRLLDAETGAFAHDWIARVNTPTSQRVYQNRGGTLPRRPPHVDASDIGVGAAVEGDGWRIRTGLARHVQPWLDSLAYRVDGDEGSIVFTGDTEPCDEIVELARGADSLVCMCWDDQAVMAANGELPAQCGTTGAATMAARAGVRRLIVTHMGPHISGPEPLARGLDEMHGLFDGEIVVATEGLRVPLSA